VITNTSAKVAGSLKSSALQREPQASTQAAGKRIRSFICRLGAMAPSGRQSGSLSVRQSPSLVRAQPVLRFRSSLNGSSRHLRDSLRNTAAMSVLQSRPVELVSRASTAVNRYRCRKRFIFTAAGSHGPRSVVRAALVALRVLRYSRFSMPMQTPSPNPALNLAPFGRWTLRDKAAQRRLALR